MKIAITTDSNSGILPDEYKSQGVYVLAMPFLVDSDPYFENVNLTQERFYELLKNNVSVSTSQPSIGDLADLWTDVLKEYDALIHIPMSSGLSQSCAAATNLAKEFDNKVYVVDNRRISVTQKESVLDALKLREAGKTPDEIKAYLETTAGDSTIYIAVDTMKYLKRGGRVTPTAAMIGTILKIKPVLQIHGDKLDKFGVVRSTQKAKDMMIEAIKTDLASQLSAYVKNGEIALAVAHTANFAEAEKFCDELKAAFPNIPFHFCEPLPLSISCHIGPGAIAVAATRIIK